jgi:hypothetical protein
MLPEHLNEKYCAYKIVYMKINVYQPQKQLLNTSALLI